MTVSRVLARAGLSRLAALEPAPLPRRYERARLGELLHIDSKKLARIERSGHRVTGNLQDHVRGVGWEAALSGQMLYVSGASSAIPPWYLFGQET
jgi:hypothetical protein